jgi:hypothetical protein
MKDVQIIDNYSLFWKSEFKNRYPRLSQEVKEHDRITSSSWYHLSDEAFSECMEYFKDLGIEVTMYGIRSELEIARLENWAAEGVNDGTKFPGMSYEEGILSVLQWLQNKDAPYPAE